MTARSAIPRRIGVLAYAARSRECVRRVLRSLGHAPLVFTNVDDLTAIGAGATTLDLLVIGDAPDTDSRGREVMATVLVATGPGVQVLRAPWHRRGRRSLLSGDAVEGIAAPRFFSDLCGVILFSLHSHGFQSAPLRLTWGEYSFDPIERTVTFGGEEVLLDAVTFDVAVEFFFNADLILTKKWLKQMLPLGESGANWHRIDNIGCTVDDLRVALQLQASNGWILEDLGAAGYRLVRVPAPAQDGSLPPRASHPAETALAW